MTVSVDAVVYYRVSNATVSVANVENAHHSTRSVLILIYTYIYIYIDIDYMSGCYPRLL